MKSTTVLLILSSFLLVANCDPVPSWSDFFKPDDDAIVPDKTDLELIDHVAMANGPPTTTESWMSLNELTSAEPSSSESGKKDSEMKSSDLFNTSSASSTSQRPSSTEESSSEADHAQSDHHEPSDATTALPTTTVLPTTNQELKDSPASSKEEPMATLPSSGTGSSSESAQSSSVSAQSSSEASQPWDINSGGSDSNQVDNELDKKEADQDKKEADQDRKEVDQDDSGWFRNTLFGTGHQQEDFDKEQDLFTDASSSTSSTTEEPVDKKVRDEVLLNDEKPKEKPPKINVAGHGSSSASVSKGFNLIAVVASILFLLSTTH